MVSSQTEIDANAIADCISQFREKRPHVHCITNSVAQHFTANVLLAAGATPSMTINPVEVGDFVDMADALLVNLGTMDATRAEAIEIAVKRSASAGKPWALDPVFVNGSPRRLGSAKRLLKQSPSLVRCNAGEFEALFKTAADEPNAQNLADELDTTIVQTGATDIISTRDGSVRLANGSKLMGSVTAMGCALTAVMVGFLALGINPLLEAASAAALFAVAGELAGEKAGGPGSFVPAFLDVLHGIEPGEIASKVRIS